MLRSPLLSSSTPNLHKTQKEEVLDLIRKDNESLNESLELIKKMEEMNDSLNNSLVVNSQEEKEALKKLEGNIEVKEMRQPQPENWNEVCD